MLQTGPEAVIIGGCVVDIPVYPLDSEIFGAATTPVDRITMGCGGDALNESIILARLGHRVRLVSKLGCDGPGAYIRSTLQSAGVDTGYIIQQDKLDTSINIVMIQSNGERSFITSRSSSLRKLTLQDILPALDAPDMAGVKLINLASIFVSYDLSVQDTAVLFRKIKERGLLLCADTTTPKHGETLQDLECMFRYLDYFFPNQAEAEMITGKSDPDDIADALLSCGIKNVILKLGSRGCLLRNASGRILVPAWPDTRCIDTTGAGDNFAAAFIAALLEGKSAADCARFANAAASICVEHLGATAGVQTRSMVDERFIKM